MAILKPKILKKVRDLIPQLGKKIKLKDYRTLHNGDLKSLDETINLLESAQTKLWAGKKFSVLIVLQGMDTAGKDSTIHHVMKGINPQGCRVQGFKEPTAVELAHDYLWRYNLALPERGEIVIFNRSHYEDVLAVKVHPEYVDNLPNELNINNDKSFWADRYEDINNFEKHLARNGTLMLKFFLHISKDEQKSRLLERLNNEHKLWKISPKDFTERKLWNEYTKAYEEMLTNTSQEYAPWIIVPADDKPIARKIVANIIATAIGALDMEFPKVDEEHRDSLYKIKAALEAEKKE